MEMKLGGHPAGHHGPHFVPWRGGPPMMPGGGGLPPGMIPPGMSGGPMNHRAELLSNQAAAHAAMNANIASPAFYPLHHK